MKAVRQVASLISRAPGRSSLLQYPTKEVLSLQSYREPFLRSLEFTLIFTPLLGARVRLTCVDW